MENHTNAPTQAHVANKACFNCGSEFEAGGRGTGKKFCSSKCSSTFHRRMQSEGGPLVAMVKAWNATRHAPAGSREAEICKFAGSQITQIATAYNDRDAEEGRPSAVDYVASVMELGVLWIDRVKI